MWKGVRVDDETLALDVTHKVGPAGDYLGEMHTAVHAEGDLANQVFASKTFESWSRREGKTEGYHRPGLRNILATHKPEPLPDSLQDQLDVISKIWSCVTGEEIP